MRYKITLSYDGSQYFGWQTQPEAVSVQETLEKALSTLLRIKVHVTGAGRTDTSVNAVGYVAHFDIPEAIDADAIGYKLNAILPPSAAVHSVCQVDENFHARFSATNREYTYFLHRRKDPFLDKYSYLCRYEIDFDKMNQAAGLLTGRHDFSCFEKTGGDNKTSVCTIVSAAWHPYTPSIRSICSGMSGTPGNDSDCWYFKIEADRYLRNMVRAIVGTLIDVGRGKRSVESIRDLIESRDRCSAGESVPGHALFLSGIDY